MKPCKVNHFIRPTRIYITLKEQSGSRRTSLLTFLPDIAKNKPLERVVCHVLLQDIRKLLHCSTGRLIFLDSGAGRRLDNIRNIDNVTAWSRLCREKDNHRTLCSRGEGERAIGETDFPAEKIRF